MAKKWYGSLDNRLEEGNNFNKDNLIHEGDSITMYYWSDRHCYYITRVLDQKHIFVKQWHVCADHSKEGGMGHQNWLYFKTCKEMHKYLNECIDKGWLHTDKANLDDIQEDSEEEWVFRYGHWNTVQRKNYWSGEPLEKPQYHRITQGLSFGVRSYYYDWEF